MEEKLERKTIVPWFSMTEWKETYKNIYSNNIDTQFAGYEKLLVWKARCPNVPIGVECTMSLLQVHIKDQQLMAQIAAGAIHPHQEYELRLMYSTAFMRFLNHIATIGRNNAETLYQMARKMEIPDWLVNLRHDIAHATCVPNLVLLREAAYFALDWLHEYYWKGEANASENYVIEETEAVTESPVAEIKELLEVWQALKLYSLANYSSINDLPDIFLRTYVKNRKNKGSARKGVIQNKESEDDFNNENLSLNSALEIIRQDITTHLKITEGYDICSFLVKTIMNGNDFIPDQGVWDIITNGKNVSCLPEWLKLLWENVLSTLQETHKILPHLLNGLIAIAIDMGESDHRCNVATIWIKELCQSIFKTNHVLTEMNNSAFNYENKIKSVKGQWKNTINNIDHIFPHLKHVMTLKLSEQVSNIFSLKKIKQIMLTPNRWVYTFLPHILLLARPSLKSEVRQKLITLIKIYIQDYNSTQASQVEGPVHTISELTQVDKAVEKEIVDEFISSEADAKSVELPVPKNYQWILCEGEYDWRRCALGVLPWQKGKEELELNFPKNIEWKAQSQTVNAAPCYDLQHNFTGKIEWDTLLKKKIKRGKISKRKNNFIKSINNAVKIIMNK